MEVQVTDETIDLSVETAKIKVIGVGGGGSNMVSYLMTTNIDPSVELIVANTDAQALMKSPAPMKIQLGNRITRGLGAGMRPEVGREAAEESYEDIKEILQGTDLVFVSAGMGGGTGTGAAPIIAKAAREVGALTIAVVTKPFTFEGGKRLRLADDGIGELKAQCDSIILILNDKLSNMIDKAKGYKETFRLVDSVLARAVVGMSNVILQVGENDINVDFADLRTIMGYQGLALMGMGEASGEDAFEAIREATESLLFDNVSINGAKGVLLQFHINPEYPFYEINEAMAKVHELVDSDAHVVFGTYSDPEMPQDAVEVTVIATGLESENYLESIQEPLKIPTASKVIQVKPTMPPNPLEHTINRLKRVSGGNTDELDIPPYLRNQAD